MNAQTKEIIWGQLSAAIDTLENAINHCPESLWGDMSKSHPFWYVAFHTLFWLDFYFSDNIKNFKPPEPFGLEEMDPAGVLPERTYTKIELLDYLEFGRLKAKKNIESMTAQKAGELFKFGRVELSNMEMLLYQMRHVQHHSAQLNMILRIETDSAPGWVFQGKK